MNDLVLGAEPVTTAVLVADAHRPIRLSLAADVEPALRANAAEAAAVAAENATYGRTTGVGANRNDGVDDGDGAHGLRLVRSHAAGAGPDLGPAVGRATMLVRAHQLCRPGSGIPFEVVAGLVRAASDGRTAPVRAFGGLGTGDITVLGELALCLLGERPWHDGTLATYVDHVDASAALAFMSSSAPTLAVAAVAADEARVVGRASIVVAALGALAIRANPQQWSEVAAGTRPSTGVERTCAMLRRLHDGCRYTPARTQDPISTRAIPFVHGPFSEAADALVDEIDRSIGARAENPRFADGGVWHHGAFQLTSLALRLDTFRLAVTQWLSTGLARTVKLNDPAYSGQTRFLAAGPQGSSGVMVLEYAAASALETVRTLADPVSRHTTTISIGTEDHASFATRGAIALHEMIGAMETIVACELLTAVRSLRLAARDRDELVLGPLASEALGRCAVLPADLADRPLVDDIDAAIALLPVLADLAATIADA